MGINEVLARGKYKDFEYIVLAMDMGHRCGYVRIPESNKLYEGYYNGVEDLTIESLFDVHGGITFSGELSGFEGFYIGFDCAHAGDAFDESIMSEEYKSVMLKHTRFPEDVIRTTEYVEEECKSLIDQIIDYSETYKL